jgi:tetratricopeptide (TPR) repeat protein
MNPFIVVPESHMDDYWQVLFDEARRENGNNNHERAEELVALAIQESELISPNTRSYSSSQCCFAMWHYIHNRFAEAEVFQQRYIDTEKQLGLGSRELGNLMMWLAEMQRKQRKLDECRQTIESAIGLFPDPPDLAGAYNELASVLEEIGDSPGTAKAMKKSAELRHEWDQVVESRTKAMLKNNENPSRHPR